MKRDTDRLCVSSGSGHETATYNVEPYLTFHRCESAARASIDEASSVESPGNQDGLLVHLPLGFVEKHLVKVPGTRHWRLPHSHNSLERLVFGCLKALQEEAPNLSAPDFEKTAIILRDLLMLALGQMGNSGPTVSPVRFANLARVKSFIRARCQQTDLRPSEVARENGMSLRYLHNLFRDEGQTVSQYIMYERLQKARRALEAGSSLTTSVSTVCFSSGFTSLSHFSTAFKRAFGVSPVDVLRNRKAARDQN